jgi:hypothetical protein
MRAARVSQMCRFRAPIFPAIGSRLTACRIRHGRADHRLGIELE